MTGEDDGAVSRAIISTKDYYETGKPCSTRRVTEMYETSRRIENCCSVNLEVKEIYGTFKEVPALETLTVIDCNKENDYHRHLLYEENELPIIFHEKRHRERNVSL